MYMKNNTSPTPGVDSIWQRAQSEQDVVYRTLHSHFLLMRTRQEKVKREFIEELFRRIEARKRKGLHVPTMREVRALTGWSESGLYRVRSSTVRGDDATK